MLNQNIYHAEIERVRDEICRLCDPEQIILFGSAAREELKDGSDLDFLVVLKDDASEKQTLHTLHRKIKRKDVALDFIVVGKTRFSDRVDKGGNIFAFASEEGKILHERT